MRHKELYIIFSQEINKQAMFMHIQISKNHQNKTKLQAFLRLEYVSHSHKSFVMCPTKTSSFSNRLDLSIKLWQERPQRNQRKPYFTEPVYSNMAWVFNSMSYYFILRVVTCFYLRVWMIAFSLSKNFSFWKQKLQYGDKMSLSSKQRKLQQKPSHVIIIYKQENRSDSLELFKLTNANKSRERNRPVPGGPWHVITMVTFNLYNSMRQVIIVRISG